MIAVALPWALKRGFSNIIECSHGLPSRQGEGACSRVNLRIGVRLQRPWCASRISGLARQTSGRAGVPVLPSFVRLLHELCLNFAKVHPLFLGNGLPAFEPNWLFSRPGHRVPPPIGWKCSAGLSGPSAYFLCCGRPFLAMGGRYLLEKRNAKLHRSPDWRASGCATHLS